MTNRTAKLPVWDRNEFDNRCWKSDIAALQRLRDLRSTFSSPDSIERADRMIADRISDMRNRYGVAACKNL